MHSTPPDNSRRARALIQATSVSSINTCRSAAAANSSSSAAPTLTRALFLAASYPFAELVFKLCPRNVLPPLDNHAAVYVPNEAAIFVVGGYRASSDEAKGGGYGEPGCPPPGPGARLGGTAGTAGDRRSSPNEGGGCCGRMLMPPALGGGMVGPGSAEPYRSPWNQALVRVRPSLHENFGALCILTYVSGTVAIVKEAVPYSFPSRI